MVKSEPEIDKRFVGIPYKFGEQDFSGADCMGTIILWYKEHGIDIEYSESTARHMKIFWERKPAEFLSYAGKFGSWISFQEIKKFDFVLFFSDGKNAIFPTFPVVMVDDRHFLSNFDKTESSVQMLTLDWKKNFWGALRPKQIVERELS